MKTTSPDAQQFQKAIASLPSGQPVVMLNLLRFRDKAIYDGEPSEMSGREAYGEYSKGALPCVAAVGGNLIWAGGAKATLIAPPEEEWHQVLLVRYPSIEAFMDMISSPEYQAVVGHRTAALDDSRLIATIEEGR